MPFPHDYWRSYEEVIDSLEGFLRAVRMISAYEAAIDARFVWRGVADATWGLHSSLYLAFASEHGRYPMELELREQERQIIDEARGWGLDWHTGGGRLSALELLAALAHYGVPTRMLDFTFNPFIALWFAVEQHPRRHGRVFAIDISDKHVPLPDADQREPWWWDEPPKTTLPWATGSAIWRPPPLEPRMVRQEACFLLGGVPSTQPARAALVHGVWRFVRVAEVRASMSVPFQLISYRQAEAAYRGESIGGKQPEARGFTLRIKNKRELLQELEQGFGYSYRSLFPDFPGLSDHGRTWFRRPELAAHR